MNRRDIVIALVILAVVAGVVYLRGKDASEEEIQPVQTLSVEDKIEEAFNLEIPEDVERAELSDVVGGTSSGIATRKLENGGFKHSVLADLPDPSSSEFYEGWLVKGEGDQAQVISL